MTKNKFPADSQINLLCVEYTDFKGYPVGGQKTFIKNMVQEINCRCFLVGLAESRENVGKWTHKKIGKKSYNYFSICRKNNIPKSIPVRLWFLFRLFRYRHAIFTQSFDAVFIQSPEAFFPFMIGRYHNKCMFRMAGANNPLKKAKFAFARHKIFQKIYNALFVYPLIRQAAMIVGINDECLELVTKVGKKHLKKVVKASVAVDLNLFHPARDKTKEKKRLGIPAEAQMIVFAGRLEEVKGLPLLIAAFGFLKAKMLQTAKLVLIGDGTQRPVLEKQCTDAGLSDSIFFTGSLPHDELKRYFQAADVFAMASLHEGLPNVILEAMACELPIVSTDVGGIKTLVKDYQTGFLAQNRDPQMFAGLIFQALNQQKEMGENARDLVKKNYSVQSVARKIEKGFELYRFPKSNETT